MSLSYVRKQIEHAQRGLRSGSFHVIEDALQRALDGLDGIREEQTEFVPTFLPTQPIPHKADKAESE